MVTASNISASSLKENKKRKGFNLLQEMDSPCQSCLHIIKPTCCDLGSSSLRLAKMILQGTVQGGRRRGRQKKRWEDNVTEWTGLKLGEALRKAENREEWRTVVARSSLVPQPSTRLRDK